MNTAPDHYFVPHGTRWPIVGSIGLFTLAIGAAMWLNKTSFGTMLMVLGSIVLAAMIIGWFATVISESENGLYNDQVDGSYRWGMIWFIFSEVVFFAVFFGALFYARQLVVPWLGGQGSNFYTSFLLWPDFENNWPTSGPRGAEFEAMGPWGLPALNTAILLSSGVTITLAHHMLQANRRAGVIVWLAATFILGALFVTLQADEYVHAYTDLNLQLDTGIYGATFYMLTGFHGLHVTVGTIMLIVIWLRIVRGHFTPQRHFAFEAVAWYWHFVDVVWLGLFVFVYWL